MSRRDESRVSRDAAGVGPHVRAGIQLVPLRDLADFSIADGEPDIRGWEVRTISGALVGRVEDLLVDAASNEVVMLDIDLADSDRHTLAPIRAAQLDRHRRVVMMDSAELRSVEDFPSLRRNEPLTDEEARVFGAGYARAYGDRGFSRDESRDWRVQRGRDDLHFRRGAAELGGGAAAASAGRDVVLDRDAGDRHAGDRHVDRDRDGVDDRSERAASRDVRYARPDEEVVVEQRPVVIEEVVVRRRVVDADSAHAADAGASGHDRTGTHDPRDRDRDGHVTDDRLRELRDDARHRDDLR